MYDHLVIKIYTRSVDGRSNQLKINRDLKEWLQKLFCFLSITCIDKNDNLVNFFFKKSSIER